MISEIKFLLAGLVLCSCSGNEPNEVVPVSEDKPSLVGTWELVYSSYDRNTRDSVTDNMTWKFTEDSMYVLNSFNYLEIATTYEATYSKLTAGDEYLPEYDFRLVGDTLVIEEFKSFYGSRRKYNYLLPASNLAETDHYIYNRICWEEFDTLWEMQDVKPVETGAINPGIMVVGYDLRYFNTFPYVVDLTAANKANWSYSRDTLFYTDKKGSHKAWLYEMSFRNDQYLNGVEMLFRVLDNEDFDHVDYFIHKIPLPDSLDTKQEVGFVN